MNPYFKSTKGYNAEVVIAKAVGYTTDSTYQDFVANAVEGEVGVFNSKTNAVYDGKALVSVGDVVFIAQKRDGAIHKTEPFEVQANFSTYTNYAAGALNKWTVDAASVTAKKGLVLEVALIELTSGSQPYHATNFYVVMKAAETVTQALARLALMIANANNPQWYAYGQIAVASSNANVLTVTAKEIGRFFKVVIRQGLEDAVLLQTVAPSLGNGSYAGIAAVEEEGAIFDGVTTNYPMHGVPAEYGITTKFAVAGTNYDVLMLTPERSQLSPMPFHKHTHKSYIFIGIPEAASVGPKEALGAMFGFSALLR